MKRRGFFRALGVAVAGGVAGSSQASAITGNQIADDESIKKLADRVGRSVVEGLRKQGFKIGDEPRVSQFEGLADRIAEAGRLGRERWQRQLDKIDGFENRPEIEDFASGLPLAR